MILTRYVVGNEVDDNLQPAAMSALHQIFKFSHAFGKVFRQIWVYKMCIRDRNADPAQLVNEGKAALESKNYQVAFTKFITYLTRCV